MSLSLSQSTIINEIADLLYDFLPGSGNSSTAFPLAAAEAGVEQFWQAGSKRPALVQLLAMTLEHKRSSFCPLILAIVRQSMIWRRGKGNPLMREEIERLNDLLPGVEFRIKELSASSFINLFPSSVTRDQTRPIDGKLILQLSTRLIQLSNVSAQARGYAFEEFLRDLFDLYKLAPKASFRIVGEQIDGSFELNAETYLLEAKWQNHPIGVADLYTFAGKINSKANWARGLFVSQSSFSEEGLAAFSRNRTSIVLMDGLDLFDTLNRNLPFDQVIAKKVRRAAETGNAFSRVRDLFPS